MVPRPRGTAPPSTGSCPSLGGFRRDLVAKCLAQFPDFVRRAGAGFNFIEDAFALLAIARRGGIDFLEHDGSRVGELLAALGHCLDEFPPRPDFLRSYLIFPDKGLGRELADLAYVVAMADIVWN